MFMNVTSKWLKILRQNIKYYFIEIADRVKERSTCNSRKVGCVLVKDKQILSTGYNGSVPGHDDCNELTCKRGCKETIHAEVNALRYVQPNECYLLACTHLPCNECLRMLTAYGIKDIIFNHTYQRDESSLLLCKEFGINLYGTRNAISNVPMHKVEESGLITVEDV